MRRAATALADVLRNPGIRSAWRLRIMRPDNLFQPYPDTQLERYPAIFAFVRGELADRRELQLLSFGCSTGEEILTLRSHFPSAWIRGLDINPRNIATCRRRREALGDPRISFAVAGSAEREPAGAYDAVFCMAVLRHGDLSYRDAQSCARHITFDAFEQTVNGLARCVADHGLLIIRHSNFRFCDAEVSCRFRPVFSVNDPSHLPQAPLFDRHNRRLLVPSYPDVVFQKLSVQSGVAL